MGDNVPRAADGLVDVRSMTAATGRLGAASRSGGRTWPGLIGVDQEGGLVARLGAPLTGLAITHELRRSRQRAAGNGSRQGASGGTRNARLHPLTSRRTPMSPSARLTPPSAPAPCPPDPRAAGNLSVGFSRGMLAAGVLSAVKHFPGHGSVTVDSHKDLPVQKATVAQLKARDWKPFQAAVAAGSPMIMAGHIAVPALEPGVPSSLSPASYAALRAMGFKGVAVTDALNMGAVSGGTRRLGSPGCTRRRR